MSKDTFIFLKEEFGNIYEECLTMEDLIRTSNYESSIIQSRKTVELIVNYIFKIDSSLKKIYPVDMDLNMKINTLRRKHIIDYKISTIMHEIRKNGNNSAHGKINQSRATALEMHQLLYNVCTYFYEKFNTSISPVTIKPYTGIDLKPKDNSINEILKRLEKLENDQSNTESVSNDNIEEQDTNNEKNKLSEDYNFIKINGSYLNGELSRLKNSSQESVEGFEKLTDFKKYLHVSRDIQNELYTKIKESANHDSNKLIMLCGNVGDGKSHLLSYYNQFYPDLMSNFEIINDATESSDPHKTSIDRLAYKLTAFNDDNINKTDKKIILLINLGVLNNFIDSDYAKKDFTKLSNILNDLNIFDVNDFNDNFDKDPVSIISFSDNNLFEFTDDPNNVSSQYLEELFSKITNKSLENPFYVAFNKDLNNKLNSPILYNYELFSLNEVQKIIINIIIKIIIKYKKIISTRELLNFIYEILVPSNSKCYNKDDSPLSYINDLLPNLLFNSTDRCDMLNCINNEDPIFKRSNVIDNLLMELNISNNSSEVLQKYILSDSLNIFEDILGQNMSLKHFDNYQKKEIVASIIRFLNIFGKENIIDLFTKDSYKNYVNYLRHYNNGDTRNLKYLKNEIESAIFNWKGKIQDDYVSIENLNHHIIAKPLMLKLEDVDNEIKERNINRFKITMLLKFKVNNSDDSIELNLDYPLYEVLTKLNKGYKPNKSEQKNLLLFNEFIDHLFNSSSTDKYLVLNIDENKKFKLIKEFDLYTFGSA